MSQFNFPELISQGREIDRSIETLRSKLIEPSKFGLGNEAFEALKDLKKEMASVHDICMLHINARNEDYESARNSINMVNDYLGRIGNVLDNLEAAATEHGYKPFQSYCEDNKGLENKSDQFEISGIGSLSLYDPHSTPVNQCHAANRRLLFNDTTSSTRSPSTLSMSNLSKARSPLFLSVKNK